MYTLRYLEMKSTLVTLEEGVGGEVNIMLRDICGHVYRLCSIYKGKLHLPRFNTEVAKQMGLELDGDHRPVFVVE